MMFDSPLVPCYDLLIAGCFHLLCVTIDLIICYSIVFVKYDQDLFLCVSTVCFADMNALFCFDWIQIWMNTKIYLFFFNIVDLSCVLDWFDVIVWM